MKDCILLINPSLTYDERPNQDVIFPFTSIMLLATILKSNGYNVIILDGNRFSTDDFIKEMSRYLNDTIFVGFSVMTSQVPWCYRLSCWIKKHFPEIKIVWGGAHPTLYPQQTISDDNIDIVVVNEACSTITLLAQSLKEKSELKNVPGIYYKIGNCIIKTTNFIPDDISTLPYMDFSLIDIPYYSRNNIVSSGYNINVKDIVALPILTGLGCVYRCTFCINVILKRRYRFRTAEEIVNRIEYLQQKYSANFFQFLDEDFFINKHRILRFIEIVEKRKLKFYFRPWLRVSAFRDGYIDIDMAQRLERIGMVAAVMGAECGSQRILDRIQKQIKVEDSIRAAMILSKTNIVPRFSLMVGLPGETKEDILATYRLAIRLMEVNKNSDVPILSFATYPGSELYKEAVVRYGMDEPRTLSEWANKDFSGYLGFYSVQQKPWVFNKLIFDRMLHYYNVGYRFKTNQNYLSRILKEIIVKITRFRFKIGFFLFPFEEYLFRINRAIKNSFRDLIFSSSTINP